MGDEVEVVFLFFGEALGKVLGSDKTGLAVGEAAASALLTICELE